MNEKVSSSCNHENDSISRQAVIDALDEIESEIADGYGYQYEKWRKYFCELPSAQPQIIYCAECIHWKHSAVRKSYCEVFDWMSKAEDFCSFAERRKEGGE